MNKLTVALICGFFSLALFAAVPTATDAQYKRSGGFVLKPGTMKGVVKIVNAQSKVTNAELRPAVDTLTKVLGINIVLESTTGVSVETAKSVKDKLQANVAVFVVDDPKLPLSLVSVEERWGIVNVAKTESGDNSTLRFSRTRNEVLRVFALVGGSGMSQFPGSVMGVGDTLKALDGAEPSLPLDVINRVHASLKGIGVTRAEYYTYIRACREGWAANPTNDVQKAIWDKVHAMPTAPIVIKPEKK